MSILSIDVFSTWRVTNPYPLQGASTFSARNTHILALSLLQLTISNGWYLSNKTVFEDIAKAKMWTFSNSDLYLKFCIKKLWSSELWFLSYIPYRENAKSSMLMNTAIKMCYFGQVALSRAICQWQFTAVASLSHVCTIKNLQYTHISGFVSTEMSFNMLSWWWRKIHP
jgi:hypothetical protein